MAGAPRNAQVLSMLADVAVRARRSEEACVLLEELLALVPESSAVRLDYAKALQRAGRSADALAQADQLIALEPGNALYRHLKATFLRHSGDYVRALPILEALVRDFPREPGFRVSLGHVLKTIGRTGDAVVAYRAAAQFEPSAGDAWWGLENLKTFRFDVADVGAMQAQLSRTELPDGDRLLMSFALGKAQEDRAEYAGAFASYARGNALQRANTRYSADANTARLHRAAEIYTADLFREREGQGFPATDPIFVVGMPRAGSTLVEQILASHPLVEGTRELEEIAAIAGALWRQAGPAQAGSPARYHEVLASLGPAALRAIGERYIEATRTHRTTGKPFFVDKMPTNFAHAGLIALALPNARIVDVRRHPMACGFSAFKQFFPRGQDFSHDLRDIGRYYRDYVDYMAHIDRVRPGAILRVAYEELVDDTEAQVRRLLDYCGLPFDVACLQFFKSDRPVRTASAEQVRRPIYREGLDHWKHFEPWLAPLREALGPLAAPAA